MDTNITMSAQEVKKCDIIQKLLRKEVNGSEAAGLLGLTVRHIRRLKKKVKLLGVKALIHGNRGKKSNRCLPEKESQAIVALVREHYHDFGPTLAQEKLVERNGINRHVSTIRSLMVNAGIWQPKRKKKEIHREWRQRKASEGEMIQYDGSYDYWFENRRGEICLLAAIDDASNKVQAKFADHEGVEPSFNFWREYVERLGKPFSIYADKFSTYSMNHQLAKENPDRLTQFERAMQNDLNIKVIKANSPQAKGRVERLFKTLQDRLIKELRLNNISSINKANCFLEEEFLPKFNTKFMVEPRSKADLHQPLSQQEKNRLDSIFSRQYKRVVKNDFTIDHKKHCYQLEKIQPVTICKRDKVIVEERMDDTLHFRLRGKYLNYRLLPEKPKRLSAPEKPLWVIAASRVHKPAADHPWRRQAALAYLQKTNQNVQVGHF